MATLNPIISNSAINNLSILSEDTAKDGFTNLGSSSNTATFNRGVVFNGQVFEDTNTYRIHGQGGNDTITTAAGNDVVYGGSGADTISTGKGQDQLYGGSGNDKLYAGADNDRLDGGSGNDVLDGGAGDDNLSGGTGNDTMAGGSGSDFFTVTLSSGTDLITDFTLGQDAIALGWDIRAQLPDTYQGAYDVEAALLNINVPNAAPGGNFSGDPSAPMLIFDAATQVLSFDADGTLGPSAAVNLVKLTGISQLSGSDFWAPAPF